jgi:hypothetical protein
LPVPSKPEYLPPERDWRFYFTGYFLNDFWNVEQASLVLAGLEPIAAPEYWGFDDVIYGAYERSAVERQLREMQDPKEGRPPMYLKRSSAPKYRADVNVGNGIHPHSLHIRSDLRHEEGGLPKLFSAADTLTSFLDVDFATIDINRQGQPPETRMRRSGTTENLNRYIKWGLSNIWVRTYFGRRLVELAGGVTAFKVKGAIVRPQSNGSVALDLHATPWLADAAELKATQEQVLPQLLKKTGLFYPDTTAVPAPKWQRPPGWQWPDLD